MRELPVGPDWQYEPKWDGFRGVLENLDGELALWSRNGRPLLRYFPELVQLGELLPAGSALDGEVVIVRAGALDFDAMQTRLHSGRITHPAPCGRDPRPLRRLRRHSSREGVALWRQPLRERRAELERRAHGFKLSARDARSRRRPARGSTASRPSVSTG